MRLTAEVGRTTILTLGLLLGGLAPAMAQNPRPADANARPAATTRSAEAAIDVSKLPIDMNRIRRKLAGVTIEEEREGLNLRYLIEVYAPAPKVELFTPNGDPNFWSGPAPYGAPTHRDMINLWTPKEHRAPAADFSGVLKWLTDRNRR